MAHCRPGGRAEVVSGPGAVNILVTWTQPSSSGTIRLSSPNGLTTLNVTVAPTFLSGTITAGQNQNINYYLTPATINCSAASGGTCFAPNFVYQWQQSPDNINYINVDGATSQNLSFSTGATQTTYYKRFVTETTTNQTGYSNVASVILNPPNPILPVVGGSVTPSSQFINYNTNTASLSSTGVTGGTYTYTFQWQGYLAAVAVGRGRSLLRTHHRRLCRIREQFGIPIGKFEGIEEPLARIAGTAYLIDAARRLTCAALNQGIHPAVISGIMKLHATERMRTAVDDAMDVHGGKASSTGRRTIWVRSIARCRSDHRGRRQHHDPQPDRVRAGPIRAHPYLLEEMNALGDPTDRGSTLRQGVLETCRPQLQDPVPRVGPSWTGGMFAPAPADAGDATRSIASSRATRRPSRFAPTWRF